MELIDRNAVLNRYQEICMGVACMDCPFNKDGCAVEKLILDSAVVDAKPVRHGKWEMKPDPYGFFDEIPVCSECGCTPKMREKSKYCSVCGALMDEVNDETKTD